MITGQRVATGMLFQDRATLDDFTKSCIQLELIRCYWRSEEEQKDEYASQTGKTS